MSSMNSFRKRTEIVILFTGKLNYLSLKDTFQKNVIFQLPAVLVLKMLNKRIFYIIFL